MMTRIRLRTYSVGQVDDALVEDFRKVRSFGKLSNIADVIISKEILGYEIRSVEDIKIAEEYVKNLHYRNLGEWLTDYMRNACINELQICKNCGNKCPKMKNQYQKGCSSFSLLPRIPEA